MGATGRYTDLPAKQVIIEELTWTNEGHVGRVVDIAMKSSVAYVAWERTYPGQAPFICGVTVSYSVGNHRGNREVITRVNTEDMGPCERQCPERILKQLSPVEQVAEGTSLEWAKGWRDECYANLKKHAEAPGDGATIKFADPIEFTDGFKGDTFTIHKRGRAFRFTPEGGERWARYRISNWQTRDFTVLPARPSPAPVVG